MLLFVVLRSAECKSKSLSHHEVRKACLLLFCYDCVQHTKDSLLFSGERRSSRALFVSVACIIFSFLRLLRCKSRDNRPNDQILWPLLSQPTYISIRTGLFSVPSGTILSAMHTKMTDTKPPVTALPFARQPCPLLPQPAELPLQALKCCKHKLQP